MSTTEWGAPAPHWYVEKVERTEPAVDGDGFVGWNLYFDSGGFTWLTSQQCAQTPGAGEVVRLFGRGFGYVIEHIEIGGRIYR